MILANGILRRCGSESARKNAPLEKAEYVEFSISIFDNKVNSLDAATMNSGKRLKTQAIASAHPTLFAVLNSGIKFAD